MLAYTIDEIRNIGSMPDMKLLTELYKSSIDDNMRSRKRLQYSLALYSNMLSIDEQIRILHICMMIERHCRPTIYKKCMEYVNTHNSNNTENRKKQLARGLTEKAIKKMSY